jgi:hypothetical protein
VRVVSPGNYWTLGGLLAVVVVERGWRDAEGSHLLQAEFVMQQFRPSL